MFNAFVNLEQYRDLRMGLGNGNWLQNWELEGMGIDHMGMGGNWNVKKPFLLICRLV